LQFRYRGSRRQSAVAQLFSLGISTRHENINHHSIRRGSIICHARMSWLTICHPRRWSFMDCAVVAYHGTFRAYEASSAQGVVVDVSPDRRSFGDIPDVAVFAFATGTESDSSLCHCGADVAFVDVGDLSAMAERERTS
jgi:hypothetical protein